MRSSDVGVGTLLSFLYPLAMLVGAFVLLAVLHWSARELGLL